MVMCVCCDVQRSFSLENGAKYSERDTSAPRIISSQYMLRVGEGGGALRYRGGRTRLTYFAEEGVFFKTSECPRFCIKRVFFCNQVRSMGVKIP